MLQHHKVVNGGAYFLSFIEFSEKGEQPAPDQARTLLEHLKSNPSNYLIIFVHGWRNNADFNNPRLSRFRTLLAYATSFLDQRCKEAGRYCGSVVTGLYVGWRGRTSFDCDYSICDLIAAPTLSGRKEVSERIAQPVGELLRTVDAALRSGASERADIQQAAPSRMLVVGHSLGGNALATFLQPIYAQAIGAHKSGEVLRSKLGDLTVLINPAAEAEKWITLQHMVRGKTDLKSHQRFSLKSHNLFPGTQHPVYISLTSACTWPDWLKNSGHNEDIRNRAISCDEATGTWFPFFKRLNGEEHAERKTTIGHFDPNPGKKIMVGTTHEMDINGSPAGPTQYRNAADPRLSKCMIVDGWLEKAKRRAKEKKSPNGIWWDSGFQEPALAPINGEGLSGQFRHGIYRQTPGPGNPEGFVITAANDPFWNVRALDTAIIQHNGYVSYPGWCALNQLVLDDITKADGG